jgi:ubiquitin carboxyl-terminal hydrolase L5
MLGSYTDDWLNVARPAIEARMQRYSSSETHFALLSIKPHPVVAIENEMQILQTGLSTASTAAAAVSHDDDAEVRQQLHSLVEDLQRQLALLQGRLDDEHAKTKRQRVENIRRRHNYIPFIVALLKILAARGHIPTLVEATKRREGGLNKRKL